MKCTNLICGGEWTPPPGKSLMVCPFCQEPIANQKKAAHSFDTVVDTLVYIRQQYGADVLLCDKMYTFFTDLTCGQLRDEKDLIKQLCEKGALDCLKAAIGKSDSEHENAIERALSKLPNYLQESPAVAGVLRDFAEALGWTIKTKTTESQPKQVKQSMMGQSPQEKNKSAIIVLDRKDYQMKLEAISRISDSDRADSAYIRIANNKNAPIEIRKEVIARIVDSDMADELWEEIARDENIDIIIRKEAIARIVDSDKADELWEEIARDENIDIIIRKEAIARIVDSDKADELWEEIARDESIDIIIRKEAIARIVDPDMADELWEELAQ